MATQIALDKADPAISDLLQTLIEGEPITFTVTAVPGSLDEAVVVLDVTDIEMEEMEGEEENEEMAEPARQSAAEMGIMPETQLRESGYDTGPTGNTKPKKTASRD